MKEHLRQYFPERFPQDGDPKKLADKINQMFDSISADRFRKTCERKVEFVFNQSDELKILAGGMKKYGCDFNLRRHVACEQCNKCIGGFDPDTKQIVICMNNNTNENKITATLMHEMVHMFDYCRVKFDFDNLEHVACSEIRAANLTYCTMMDRLRHGGPGMFDFKRTHQYCVKDVAFQSVKAYSPETSDEKLWDIVDKVFPDCYNDLEPFGRRPTSGMPSLKHSYRERFRYGYEY